MIKVVMLTVGKFAVEKCEFLRAPSLSKKSSSIDKCVYIQCYNLQGFGGHPHKCSTFFITRQTKSMG
jgi:hypothetical protein